MEESMTENAIDVVSAVKDTINTLFSSLFSSIRSTVFPLLDDIVFIGDDIAEGSSFAKLFGTDLSSRSTYFGKFSLNLICFILRDKIALFLHHRKRYRVSLQVFTKNHSHHYFDELFFVNLHLLYPSY